MRFLISLLLLLPISVLAQVTLQNQAYKVVAVQQADGTAIEQWQDADTITPGDKVGYRITYKNSGTEAASNIVINNPIPEKTEFVANSAKGLNSNITYSADGGDNFAVISELTVIENGQARKARAEDITHIRWSLTQSIAPASEGSVEFQVRVQ